MPRLRPSLLAATVVFAAAPAAAQQGQPGQWGQGGHRWGGPMMDGWFGPFGGLIWLILVVAVLVAAVLLVRYLWNVGHQSGGHAGARTGRSEALELLDKRYAAGEIDREEYLRRKQDLQR
jgi:putative membrane protein